MRRIILAVIIIFSISIPTQACWAYLSIEEMDAQADMIVIGVYTGNMREVITKDGTGLSYWSIEVNYVIKGDPVSRIEVVTGGASNAKVMVSTDYKLTDNASGDMLLYLSSDSNGFRPLTPRGIVDLESSEEGGILGAYEVKSVAHDEVDCVDIPKFIAVRQETIVDTSDMVTNSADGETKSSDERTATSDTEPTEVDIPEQQSLGWIALLILPVTVGMTVIARKIKKRR